MDQALDNFLTKLGFADDDIEFLCAGCPGLANVSAERALQNIALVLRYGYPEADLDSLITVNPNFLLDNPTHLEQTLVKIGDDLDGALKDDPYLI